jgi:DNA-binding response OmpR family regulator
MKKILLIEDDKLFVRIYRNQLTKAGYEVKFLENGINAVKTAKEFKPDLIMLDIVMPVKDGFDSLEELKADSMTSEIPVFILSALESETDIKKVRELRAKKYIFKSSNSLKNVVSEINKFLQ